MANSASLVTLFTQSSTFLPRTLQEMISIQDLHLQACGLQRCCVAEYLHRSVFFITFDEQHKSTPVTVMGEKEAVFKISSPKYIQQTLKEATDTKYKQKVSEQLWLGNYVTQRWKDNDISKHNFNPIVEKHTKRRT